MRKPFRRGRSPDAGAKFGISRGAAKQVLAKLDRDGRRQIKRIRDMFARGIRYDRILRRVRSHVLILGKIHYVVLEFGALWLTFYALPGSGEIWLIGVESICS